jgi:uncharacterized BrkB/YihY/UPF0761 family membrane protein
VNSWAGDDERVLALPCARGVDPAMSVSPHPPSRWHRRRGGRADDPKPAGRDPSDGARHRSFLSGARAARVRIGDTRTRIEAQRPTNRGIDTVFRWVQLQIDAGAALIAGAIAFRIFLFLLPWVFVVMFGLGVSADAVGADPRAVARSFGMTGLAASAMDAAATTSALTRWVTFSLAVIGLALGAWNLLRALLVSHALIWRIPMKRPRHMTLSVLSIIGAVLLSNLFMGLLARTRTGLAEWIAGVVLLTLVVAGVWMAGSLRVFPRPEDVTWRGVIPGALLFAFGVELLHVVTVVWFAPYLQSKSQTYGAIGAAFAILLWAYLLGRVITGAAALNAVMWDSPSPAAQPAPEP